MEELKLNAGKEIAWTIRPRDAVIELRLQCTTAKTFPAGGNTRPASAGDAVFPLHDREPESRVDDRHESSSRSRCLVSRHVKDPAAVRRSIHDNCDSGNA